MKFNNITKIKNTKVQVEAPYTYDLEVDDEGFYIIGSSRYGEKVMIPDDVWMDLKSKLTVGIKVTYLDTNTVCRIPLSAWVNANVNNLESITSLITNNRANSIFIFHHEDNLTNGAGVGSDYTAISLHHRTYQNAPATWNMATSIPTYGLLTKNTNVQVAIK